VVIRTGKRSGPDGLEWQLASGTGSTAGSGRRLGDPTSPVAERRGQILSATYAVATLGAIAIWAVAPGQVLNVFGVGIPIGLAGAAAVAFFVLRRHLPRFTEDVAVVASLALLGVGIAYIREAALFTPYYIWVGFSAPLWFPPRRAVGYLCLTAAACGAEMLLVGTATAMASWFATLAILIIAFFIVLLLSRALVDQGRLAAVGEMASAVGHELRNPLASVVNALFLIRSQLGEQVSPDLERHLRLAEDETRRAASISENLMAFVRPRRAEVRSFSVEELVTSVLASTPPPTGVHVEIELAGAWLVADRDQIGEVLTNLVDNAYKAMPDGGTLRLEGATENRRLSLQVQDTGVGMDRSVKARIFEPFFTTRAQGTGLGLAIVQRLVEGNGGTVRVRSEPGEGTCFTLRLPRASRPGRSGN
jgi:signal transduction histidine kinase